MHERPADLTDAEVAVALAEHWGLRGAARRGPELPGPELPGPELRYLPVGFGGYHWLAAEPDGGQWFVTASRLRDAVALAGLTATMTAAARLAADGLDFVVAPRLTPAGLAACPLRPGWAVTLFPVADGVPGRFGPAG
jgi:spectinomycin phosphotransferase